MQQIFTNLVSATVSFKLVFDVLPLNEFEFIFALGFTFTNFTLKDTGIILILKAFILVYFVTVIHFKHCIESLVIFQFLFTFENSFTIFTLKSCSNSMLLFLVFLYLFYICVFLPTSFAIQTLILFHLTSVNN